jgi:hypothetical protein
MTRKRISALFAAPGIETERTRLRAHRLEDFEPMIAM